MRHLDGEVTEIVGEAIDGDQDSDFGEPHQNHGYLRVSLDVEIASAGDGEWETGKKTC